MKKNCDFCGGDTVLGVCFHGRTCYACGVRKFMKEDEFGNYVERIETGKKREDTDTQINMWDWKLSGEGNMVVKDL